MGGREPESVRVVAIQGSPHRGNTYDRVERFGEALRSLGDVEFEHVALKDVDLEPCRGCFLCFSRGESVCPLDDDRAELERKMLEADAVVFATPVHSMHVSHLLKAFVDRFAYTFHRPRYFGRYAVGLAVTGGIGLKEALGYVRMFAGSWGFEYVGDLRYVDPPLNSDLPRMVREADRTEEVARRLYERMKERPPRRLSRDDHLHFHAMRAVYSRLETFAPVDHAYWKERGWLEPGARYFTAEARAGFLRGLFARLVAWMMGRSIDRSIRCPGRAGAADDE